MFVLLALRLWLVMMVSDRAYTYLLPLNCRSRDSTYGHVDGQKVKLIAISAERNAIRQVTLLILRIHFDF